ncbi:unnamed protein product [Ixodes pacificus]
MARILDFPIFLVVGAAAFAVLLSLASATHTYPSDPVLVCINNCGQCKMVYGEYFNGRQCAEECLSTAGFIQPDCDEADSIVKYLRRKP